MTSGPESDRNPYLHPIRELSAFFVLTYVVTWLLWAVAWAVSTRFAPGSVAAAVSGGVFLLGVFAPGLLALGLTCRAGGGAAASGLLKRIAKADVSWRWYVFAASFMAAIKLVGALLYRLGAGAWPAFGETRVLVMLGAIAISTLAQAGEELGWRGYALPRLSQSFGLAPASLILGGIWALWHLPLFFFPGGDTFGQSFPFYLLQVTALSVMLAWLFWRTQGSLLLVMLAHASVNNTKDIVPAAVPGATDPLALHASGVGWLTLMLLWVTATGFLVRMRGVRSPLDGPSQSTRATC